MMIEIVSGIEYIIIKNTLYHFYFDKVFLFLKQVESNFYFHNKTYNI